MGEPGGLANCNDPAIVDALAAPYERAGYPVHRTSVKQPAGLRELHDALVGRTSAFTGPSGVGKSSLLNLLARRDMAIVRLTSSEASLIAIAADLGFTDSTAFQRAFKVCTGKEGCATKMTGNMAPPLTGTKSRSMSYDSLGLRLGRTE